MLRSTKACSACHTRKVRCDMSQVGLPCSKCQNGGFECIAHDRKRREKKTDRRIDTNRPSKDTPAHPHTIPEHHMLHKFPFYSLFRNLPIQGRARLASKDPSHGVSFPMPMEDPSASQAGPGSTLSTVDMQYLQQKGALSLPPRPIMDEMVRNYFRLFHAFFPVVDREDFFARYRDCDEKGILAGQGPSLLLLQAILFTASPTCDTPALRSMGFSSTRHARSSLYDRCRRLYNLSYEPDDIANIQALLLMSQYFPSMDGQKHTWLWAHQAITLAQGIGLHREPGQSAPQRHLWVRIWWACLIRDRLIALGTRRPLHINSLDCSTRFPTLADLAEEGDSQDDVAVKSIFLEFAKLCHYMEGVLSLPLASQESLPQQIAICEEALEQWRAHLGPFARRLEQATGARERGSVPALYRTILHLMFNTIIIVLRQSGSRLDEIQNSGQKPPSPAVQIVAESSTRLIKELDELDMIDACPTICVTTTLPLLAFHLHVLQTSDEPSGGNGSKDGFRDCLRFLRQLGQVHWHAGFYHDFFQMLASRWVPESERPAKARISRARRPIASAGRNDDASQSAAMTSRVLRIHGTDAGGALDSTLPRMESAVDLPFEPYPELQQPLDLSPTQDQDAAFDGWMDFDESLFAGWLDDYARMQNLFPSA